MVSSERIQRDGSSRPLLERNMIVADVLNEWPQVIPVFLRHRMACVGCSMSIFETVGDAAKIYGMDPEVFLNELHMAIQANPRK